VPRLYSPEWVAAFNEAVSGLDAGEIDTGASLAADGGRFRVLQVVHGAPGGELAVILVVTGRRVSLEVSRPGGPEAATRPDVTVSLSYEDAAELSRGRLDPAEALGMGRIRVRGDLAVLLAGQALLASAAEHLSALQASTTY